MFSGELGQELGGATLTVQDAHCLCEGLLHAEHHFVFLPFFLKAKILFRFLLVSEKDNDTGKSFRSPKSKVA